MNSIWYSLIWKEWHEHKWKLVSILAVLLGTTALPLLDFNRDMFAGAAAFLFIGIVPIAVFIGLGVAANERSRRTLAFVQSLPVPLWRLALVKLTFGLVALSLPILLTLAWLYLWQLVLPLAGVNIGAAVQEVQKGVLTGSWYLDCLLLGTAIAASMLIWSAAAGVNRKDEVSAGAVALAVMVGWYLILFAIGYVLSPWYVRASEMDPTVRWLYAFGLSTAPIGFAPAAALRDGQDARLAPVIVTAVATHLALGTWYVRRFGRIENVGVRSPQAAVRDVSRPDWLGLPRRSPVTAIAWKQARESGVLVLAGLAGVVGISALMFLGDPLQYISRPGQLAQVIAAVTVSFGCGIALIVGIGVCLYNVGPQLNTFWRSRPINPDVYFWCKYTTGLLVLLVALYVPLVAIVWALHHDPARLLFHRDSIILPPIHIALFAAAVAMTCLVRHAVYAAILSIAVVYMGVLAGIGISLVPRLLSGLPLGPQWWEPNESQIVFGIILSFATSTLIAWLAMHYNWGRKSRY